VKYAGALNTKTLMKIPKLLAVLSKLYLMLKMLLTNSYGILNTITNLKHNSFQTSWNRFQQL